MKDKYLGDNESVYEGVGQSDDEKGLAIELLRQHERLAGR